MANDPILIEEVIACLTAGGLMIYPTETSYGLGADATSRAAIQKLLAYKGNRLNKALSVAVSSKEMASDYIEMNPTAESIFNTLLPGPITVVAKGKNRVAAGVESSSHTLGIRWSSYDLVNQLVSAFNKPITATSANTSGAKQIFSFEEWQQYVPPSRQDMIDLFIDAGKLPINPPSTIVDTTLENPEILRQGELIFGDGATHFSSNSPEETTALGKQLVEQQMDLIVTQPLVIALEGELGAGKTHFVKGVAEALGITELISSPTYTIMREYPYSTSKIGGMLYHIDTWRLFEGENVGTLGIESRIGPGTIIAIEWQQKAKNWIESLKKPILIASVKIDTMSEAKRRLTIWWDHRNEMNMGVGD
jgi:L-threonylcarbamoyladenylate synthase